jgi:electron transfer flavoprotein beta subunit
MQIAVCIKLVPATTADIRVSPDGSALQLSGVETLLNPYDEFALEAALKLREGVPGSKIQAITVGGDEALKALTHAFSLGVDSGVHIKADTDARGAALAVAALLKSDLPDVVLCGRQAVDDDLWQFPGTLAEALDFSHATAIATLDVTDTGFQCKRRVEGAEYTLAIQKPAVLSCDKGLNEPRAATLKGRLDAKKKQPVVKTPADLGLSDAALASPLTVVKYAPPPQKTPGKVITSEPAAAAAELVALLRNEAKVI